MKSMERKRWVGWLGSESIMMFPLRINFCFVSASHGWTLTWIYLFSLNGSPRTDREHRRIGQELVFGVLIQWYRGSRDYKSRIKPSDS